MPRASRHSPCLSLAQGELAAGPGSWHCPSPQRSAPGGGEHPQTPAPRGPECSIIPWDGEAQHHVGVLSAPQPRAATERWHQQGQRRKSTGSRVGGYRGNGGLTCSHVASDAVPRHGACGGQGSGTWRRGVHSLRGGEQGLGIALLAQHACCPHSQAAPSQPWHLLAS